MDSGCQRQIKKLSKHQNEENSDQPQNFFGHLPHEIGVDILSRLPITSLIQFSFVCHSLNSLSHDPLLAKIHLSRSSTNESLCLIFHSDYPLGNQLHFLQLSNHHNKVKKIDTPFAESMPEFTVIGSCNGLLCLVNSLFVDSIYLYNPFTRYLKELPKNFDFKHDHIVVYGFGIHPNCNEWKVIKIGSYQNFYHNIGKHCRGFRANNNIHISEVQLYSSRTNTWTNKGIVPYKIEKWSSPGVLVNGRLHWVSQWGRFNGQMDRIIVAYDLINDSFHVIRKPCLDAVGFVGRWTSFHLAEFEGQLSAAVPVVRGQGAIDIWMMKEYGVDESWVKEYSIGVYCPVSMISHEMERSCHMWRNMFGRKFVNILCLMKGTGELLLEYRGGGLVLYDPQAKVFKELRFEGQPRLFQTTLLVGSLTSAA